MLLDSYVEQGLYNFSKKKNFKDFPHNFPGLRLVFPGFQISPKTLSFPRFQDQFS